MILLVWSWLEDERQGSTILTMEMRKFDEYAKHKARRLDIALCWFFSLWWKMEDGLPSRNDAHFLSYLRTPPPAQCFPLWPQTKMKTNTNTKTKQRQTQRQTQRQRQTQTQTQRQFISYLRTPNCPFLFYKQQKLVSLSCVFNLFETKSLPFPQSKYPQPSFSTIKYMVLIFPIYKEPPPTAFLCLKGWLVTTFSC